MILQFVTRQVDPDITVIEFSGALTMGNSLMYAENELKKIMSAGQTKVVLDLTQLTYLDSSGIGFLVMTSGAMTMSGGQLRVAGASERVTKIFEMTHIDRVVSLFPDVASACGSFGSADSAPS